MQPWGMGQLRASQGAGALGPRAGGGHLGAVGSWLVAQPQRPCWLGVEITQSWLLLVAGPCSQHNHSWPRHLQQILGQL